MADHNEVAYTTADGNDYPAHEQTYEGFIMLVKYGTAAVVVIVGLMGFFLTCCVAGCTAKGGDDQKICILSGCETGIQLSGNNASLLARAHPAPPEAP
jgi:hypothetical protein